MNNIIYNLRLRVENSQELFNSVLQWKYCNENKHKTIKSTHQQDNIAHFQILAKKSTPIEYWYQNSEQIRERRPRMLFQESFNQNLVDKFNCFNIVVLCQAQNDNLKQYSILSHQGESKQKIIIFNEQQLLYLDSKNTQIQFILESLENEDYIREVKFQIELNQSLYISNQYYLEITELDLQKLNSNNQNFISKKGQFEFQKLSYELCQFEDIFFFKYYQIFLESTQKEDIYNIVLNETLKLESIYKPLQKYSESFIQIDNLYQDLKQQTENIRLSYSKQLSQIEGEKQITWDQNDNEKLPECNIQNRLKDHKKQQDEQFQIIESQILQTQKLEFIQTQNILIDQSRKIHESEKQLKKMQNDYQETIKNLNLTISNLKIQIKNLEEENKELKVKFTKFYIFKNRKYQQPKFRKYQASQSTNGNLQLNSVLQAVKYQPDLEQRQIFEHSIENMTKSQMTSRKVNDTKLPPFQKKQS